MISTKHRAKTIKGVISACKRKMESALKRPNRYESLRAARNARTRIARQLKPEWRDKLKVVEYPR